MEEEFDAPLFKVLAKNDTGKAASNQGGPVIPKELQAGQSARSNPKNNLSAH
jgi:hypothetical protein